MLLIISCCFLIANRVNGGYAPLTYQMMLHTVNVLGLPPRAVNDNVDFSKITFGRIPGHLESELKLIRSVNILKDI